MADYLYFDLSCRVKVNPERTMRVKESSPCPIGGDEDPRTLVENQSDETVSSAGTEMKAEVVEVGDSEAKPSTTTIGKLRWP